VAACPLSLVCFVQDLDETSEQPTGDQNMAEECEHHEGAAPLDLSVMPSRELDLEPSALAGALESNGLQRKVSGQPTTVDEARMASALEQLNQKTVSSPADSNDPAREAKLIDVGTRVWECYALAAMNHAHHEPTTKLSEPVSLPDYCTIEVASQAWNLNREQHQAFMVAAAGLLDRGMLQGECEKAPAESRVFVHMAQQQLAQLLRCVPVLGRAPDSHAASSSASSVFASASASASVSASASASASPLTSASASASSASTLGFRSPPASAASASASASAATVTEDAALRTTPQQLIMYIAGEGGSGKSRVIKALRQFAVAWRLAPSLCVTATSGIAGVLIGGSTYHSALGMTGRKKHGPSTGSRRPELKLAWQGITTVVIDEVSMLGRGHLKQIEQQLNVLKGTNPDRTGVEFGGCNIIFL
jgi:hypothetical protein